MELGKCIHGATLIVKLRGTVHPRKRILQSVRYREGENVFTYRRLYFHNTANVNAECFPSQGRLIEMRNGDGTKLGRLKKLLIFLGLVLKLFLSIC